MNKSLIQDLKVYVINLDRRTDRWASVQNTLLNAGFTNIERVSAIDGKLMDSGNVKNLVDSNVYPYLGQKRDKHEDLGSLGAIGCALSHYKIWNKISETNEPAIIVEDDLIIYPSFHNFKVSKNTKYLQNFDFVLLSATVREPALISMEKLQNNQGIVPYHGLFFGLHFYYITPTGARFFLSDFLPMKFQVDSFMAFKMQKNPQFRCGVHIPIMGSQSGFSTDIQTPMNLMSQLSQIVYNFHQYPIHQQFFITCGGIVAFLLLIFIIFVICRFIIHKI
jgi:GR25 family glycosyltransferase involved in LPS biosynthesis